MMDNSLYTCVDKILLVILYHCTQKPSVSLDWAVSALLHAKPDSRRNKRKSSPEDPTVVKAVEASVVGAPRAGCGTPRSPGHPLQPGSLLSKRFSVPLDQDFPGRESGIAPVHRSSHYKNFTHRSV